jgi:hypothetical protein
MEVENLENHLKYVNANGVTLSIDERLNLDLALQKLQLDFGFEELNFWGKVNGKLLSMIHFKSFIAV